MFSPRARKELRSAAVWIARESPASAEALLNAAVKAAERIAARPGLVHIRLDLTPSRFRFWSLRGFPYLLVIDATRGPAIVARFVDQARDLPVVFIDLA